MSKKTKDKYYRGLCHRCEWRAVMLETNVGIRAECKAVGAVHCCYAYKPAIPCKLRVIKGDTRSPFGGLMLGARMQVVGLADGFFVVTGNAKDGYAAYYVPESRKSGKEEKKK